MRGIAAISIVLLLGVGCAASPEKQFIRQAVEFMDKDDVAGVGELAERYASLHPQSDTPEMLLLALADRCTTGKKYRCCIQLLDKLVSMYPDSVGAQYAFFRMGKAYRDLNDFAKAVESYEKAATFPESAKTPKWAERMTNITYCREDAKGLLAELLEKVGRLEEALKWYREWEPCSWCGACWQMQKNQRDKAIVRLQRSLEGMGAREPMSEEGFDRAGR